MFEEKQLEEVRAGKERYRASVEKAISRNPERKERFRTVGGIPVERLYTPEDVNGLDYAKDLGFPGEYPYTRGGPADDVPWPVLDHKIGRAHV